MKEHICLLFVILLTGQACGRDLFLRDVVGVRSEHDPALYHDGCFNGGCWYCPWTLGWFECSDGEFKCTCPGTGGQVKFRMGCCYSFPDCGYPCHYSHTCNRWQRCHSCRSGMADNDWRACNSCQLGYVFENGLCDKDLNECASNNGGCDQICTNTYGSYYCGCHSGFRLNSNAHTCDILSCTRPDAISGGTVQTSDAARPWVFASYAKFSCNDVSHTLSGAYAIICTASGTSLYWREHNPSCIDTCVYVDVSQRKECGTGVISEDLCLQRGCCYDNSGVSPHCFLNPTKFFMKFGAKRLSAEPSRGSHPERSAETCAHVTVNEKHLSMYMIRHDGSNATHDVMLQTCMPYAGRRDDYVVVDEDMYDIYESIDAFLASKSVPTASHEIKIQSKSIESYPLGMFTLYPEMRSFISPRLVIKMQTAASTPVERPDCMNNCSILYLQVVMTGRSRQCIPRYSRDYGYGGSHTQLY